MQTKLLEKVQCVLCHEKPAQGLSNISYSVQTVDSPHFPTAYVYRAHVEVGATFTAAEPGISEVPRLISKAIARELYGDLQEMIRDMYPYLYELEMTGNEAGRLVSQRLVQMLEMMEG